MKNFILPCIILVLALPVSAFACGLPSSLQAVPAGTTAVLNWTAQSDASSYHIEVEDALNNPVHFFVETTVSGTAYTVTGLTPGQNYKFKVRSNCGGDHSDWSDWFYFTSSSLVATQEAALTTNAGVKVLPTIVTTGFFRLALTGFETQDISIHLLDATGKICMQMQIHTGFNDSLETITLPAGMVPGVYYVQITSATKQLVSRLLVAA